MSSDDRLELFLLFFIAVVFAFDFSLLKKKEQKKENKKQQPKKKKNFFILFELNYMELHFSLVV